MRIVQTFWTAGKSPLKESFGWRHPEYNLMSWALSCLSLREHYDEVVLYTDSIGKEILIDTLHLPYTDVHVVFDDFDCLPQHWALAKIKTYSMQTKPFLHVDGDVYLSQPIPEDIQNAPVISQNQEKGTDYYRKIVSQLLSCQSIILPEYFHIGLSEESIKSHNMGLFGGNNLHLIQEYSNTSLKIYESIRNVCHDGNLNLLLEQIFFAYFCEHKSVSVSSVMSDIINDNGYTVQRFCSLDYYHQRPLLHILGGHKRRIDVSFALSRRLLVEYPAYFHRVLALFPYQHPRLFFKGELAVLRPSGYESISEYFSFLEAAEYEWKNVDITTLLNLEYKMATSCEILFCDENNLLDKSVFCLPTKKIFNIPKGWSESKLNKLKEYLAFECMDTPICCLGLLPSVLCDCRRIVILQHMDVEILTCINDGIKSLSKVLCKIVNTKPKKDKEVCTQHVLSSIKYLISNKILLIH